MIEIPLTRGAVALVDCQDYTLLSQHTWCLSENRKQGNQYAVTSVGRKTTHMHVMLLGQIEGLVIDHKNGNSLDNRRGNLRFVTEQVNMLNRRGALGITFNKKYQRWYANCGNKTKGNGVFLGSYKTRHAAFMAVYAYILQLDAISAWRRLMLYMSEGLTGENNDENDSRV